MSNGIYFTKLAVLGFKKKPAQIDLTKGLNVISGGSDTGKSYILECINYVLGGRDEPKDIPQARGYNNIRAEMRSFDGKTITLSRPFKFNKIYAADCPFHEFGKNQPISLSTKHSEFTDNVSLYLLSMLQLTGKKMKSTRYNDKKKLSLRDLIKFCLIDEKRIITEQSPIYEGVVYDQTLNNSVFKFLLTGQDDSDLPLFENPEHGKSRIKGKIDLIQLDIDSKKKELVVLKERSQKLTSEEVNVQIQKLLQIVEDAYQELNQQEKARSKIWSELNRLEAILMHNEELKKRFELLNRSYSSDLDRLEFINEGKCGIDQLKDVNCPICNSLIDKKLLEPYDAMGANLLTSISAEYSKISKKQIDLTRAIKDVEDVISSTKTEIGKKTKDFKQIDKYIADKLRPVHKANSENLNAYLKLRGDRAKADLLESQISDLTLSLAKYDRMLKQRQKKAPEIKVSINMYDEFVNNVREILQSWHAHFDNISFDENRRDIVINGSNRGVFGKGYRALFFSAFMLGLLQHSINNRLNHPRFLILDSPLTTFHEGDRGSKDPQETIPEEIKNSFYEGIANLNYLQRVQIIILDNIEPPTDIQNRINHIHFSRKTSGQYGFFPV